MTGRRTPASAGASIHHLGDFTADRRMVFLAALAVVVGSASVGSAWVLLKLIWLVTSISFFGQIGFNPPPFATSPLGAWMIAIPVIGGVIVGYMARYGSDKIRGHGIPEAMEAILIGQSRLEPKVAVLKPLSSAVAIGTGGPFGAEGPIIMTGGAIGSLIAQLFPVTAAERKTMLVAGAAAGMVAIFGTPFGACLLAVELLLFEWKPRSLIPVIVAAAVAAAERPLLIGHGALFPCTGTMPLSVIGFLAWIGIGLLCGLGAALASVTVYACEDAFKRLPVHWMWWPAIGGVVVGVGGWIDPAALGVGYTNIAHLLVGDWHGGPVVALLFVKAIIWAVALGSGTSGGVLAPLLMVGGALAAVIEPVLPAATPGFWALLGMAAMMGGTMRAPLTATIFAVELTGDLNALLPLLVACGASYAVTVLLLKRSILTEKIARRGTHIMHEYKLDPFDLTPVSRVMVTQVETLPADMSLEDAAAFFAAPTSRFKSYPVVDRQERLAGLVTRADMLRLGRKGLGDNRTLGELVAGRSVLTGQPGEMIGELADRMIAADVGRVPILGSDGTLVGLVARKDLLSVRAELATEEQVRARILRLVPRQRRLPPPGPTGSGRAGGGPAPSRSQGGGQTPAAHGQDKAAAPPR